MKKNLKKRMDESSEPDYGCLNLGSREQRGEMENAFDNKVHQVSGIIRVQKSFRNNTSNSNNKLLIE